MLAVEGEPSKSYACVPVLSTARSACTFYGCTLPCDEIILQLHVGVTVHWCSMSCFVKNTDAFVIVQRFRGIYVESMAACCEECTNLYITPRALTVIRTVVMDNNVPLSKNARNAVSVTPLGCIEILCVT